MYPLCSTSLVGSPNILYTLVARAYFCLCTVALGLSTLGGGTSLFVLLFTFGRCASLLLLLLSTLGRCAATSDTLGRVAVLTVARVVGFNKFDNTPMALLMLLSVNDISRFLFAFIAAVNSSSTVVALSAATISGNSNFDGMNTYASVCLFPLVDGR